MHPPAPVRDTRYSPVNGTHILGILSFFCFGVILGPIAWVMGNNGLKTLDQYGDPMSQRGSYLRHCRDDPIGSGNDQL